MKLYKSAHKNACRLNGSGIYLRSR